jgi:hypothetical protein
LKVRKEGGITNPHDKKRHQQLRLFHYWQTVYKAILSLHLVRVIFDKMHFFFLSLDVGVILKEQLITKEDSTLVPMIIYGFVQPTQLYMPTTNGIHQMIILYH